ncbi:MAG: hypothetical protein ACFFD8_02720 [Candidatus Thorarchaeota archaeon]
MSKERASDRQFMRRTMIICIVGLIVFGTLLYLLATGFGAVGPVLDLLGPVIVGVFVLLLLTLSFISLLVLFGNIREWYGESAGWFEIIILWAIIVVIAFVGFSWFHALLTALLCIGVIYYLHAAQD